MTGIAPEDIPRFMRTRDGCAFLKGIRDYLKGRTIRNVVFQPEMDAISTTLELDNGNAYTFIEQELELDVLRDQFKPVFQRLAQRTPRTAPQTLPTPIVPLKPQTTTTEERKTRHGRHL